ncbi:MAG: DUF3106 domain-containing protein [Pseudomonadota bacterium]
MGKRTLSPCLLAVLAACGLASPCLALAQVAPNAVPSLSSSSAHEDGVSWTALNASHRTALAPLQDQWTSLSATTKDKWIRVARRMAAMQPTERERIQGRMADWARLTPVQRGQARLYFQEARNVAPEVRSEQWKRYNELSDDEKRQLTARAVPPAATRSVSGARGAGTAFSVNDGQPAAKINTTPTSAAAPLPQRIAPSVVQAQPGATTRLISSRPQPPLHQPAGMPKIGAAPAPAPVAPAAAEPRTFSQPLSPSTDIPAQP